MILVLLGMKPANGKTIQMFGELDVLVTIILFEIFHISFGLNKLVCHSHSLMESHSNYQFHVIHSPARKEYVA